MRRLAVYVLLIVLVAPVLFPLYYAVAGSVIVILLHRK